MITEEKISQIRERASIVEVISDHLTLKKAGRNHLGLCPFHGEKTPSFTVNEEKGIFHCFGCHVGGNVFHFLMQYEHLSFPEAVERVGKRYGIPVERLERPGGKAIADERESLYRINEKAAAYFHETLFGRPEGKRALDYLKRRGVDDSTARRFFLGYASPSGPGLAGFIQKNGLPVKDALRLGLIGERGGQRYGDKFFDRLMFPIVNPAGKIVGFGGRVLGEGMPKYLNSAETPLFHKGNNLYGLFQAKEAIREKDRVLVVEGYLDVIALGQFEIAYAVATLGTALTPDQVRILARYTKNIVALFDGDDAGTKAAARSFEIFIEAGLLGRAAFLPKGEDPDTFVRAKGKAALEEIIDQAIPLADYYFSWLEGQYGRTIEGKGRIANEISRILSKIQNPFEADLLARRAADSLGIREDLLRVTARLAADKRQPPRPSPPEKQNHREEDLADRSLVSLMLRFPAITQQLEWEEDLETLLNPQWRPIVQAVLAQWRQKNIVDPAALAEALAPELVPQVTVAWLEGEIVHEDDCQKAMVDCLSHLKRRYLRRLERELRQAIRLAEEKKDEKVKKERMLEWQEVVRKERQLERQRTALKS